jgi:hypothetical protein
VSADGRMTIRPAHFVALFLQVIPMMIAAQPRIQYTLSMPRPSSRERFLEGGRITTSGLQQRLKDFKPGDAMRLTVFRNDRLRDFTMKLEKPRVTPYRVRQTEHMTPGQKAILDSWLPDGGS